MNSPLSLSATLTATSHFSSQRLLNKIAIVTGSSSGIGRAIALAYAAEGAAVVCSDLQPDAKAQMDEKDVKPTHEVIGERGGRAIFVECDVGDSPSVQRLVEKAVQEYGRLDVMVNNAGIAIEAYVPKPIHEADDEVYDKTMRVNSRSVFLGTKYAGKQMIKQDPHPSGDRGWIINTASMLSMVGYRGAVSYTASKGSALQITKTAALDYAPYRIHVNALCPGFVRTSIIKPILDNAETSAALAATHPFRGLGEPKEIAKAAVFLASDDASWISGSPLIIDGAYLAQ